MHGAVESEERSRSAGTLSTLALCAISPGLCRVGCLLVSMRSPSRRCLRAPEASFSGLIEAAGLRDSQVGMQVRHARLHGYARAGACLYTILPPPCLPGAPSLLRLRDASSATAPCLDSSSFAVASLLCTAPATAHTHRSIEASPTWSSTAETF